VVPGYPDRILPVSEKAAQILKKRTLTNFYNERPAWLDTCIASWTKRPSPSGEGVLRGGSLLPITSGKGEGR
jgi:hypothetical protein